ncbi:MAG: hypothetical protein ACPH7H_08105 [Porticoccaceae bacterium]
MRSVLNFIIKYEFWVLYLLVVGLYVAEWKLETMWLGGAAMIIFLIATTRLAYHPMWKKQDDQT